MRNKTILMFVLMYFLFCLSDYACGGSIWAKRDRNMKDPYTDDVARQVGDVLTIIINEESKVDNKAKRDLSKKTNRSITFDGKIGNFGDLGEFGTSAKSDSELKGKADFKDERSFEDRITVVVQDVLPNGNLVIHGTRHRDIADDKQVIEVSGVVRVSDIEFDNTVRSEQVANFSIITKNAGVAEPYNRPGWLGRIFDILWPF